MGRDGKIDELFRRAKKLREACVLDGQALVMAYQWDAQDDLRITSNKRVARLVIALTVSLLCLSRADEEQIAAEIQVESEADIQPKQFLLVNELFLKVGYVSSLFFVVESVFRDYLRYLDQERYERCRSLMDICSALVNDMLSWDLFDFDCSVFNLLRLIRNSLHNNGIHLPLSEREKHVTIQYRDEQFEFKEGERLDFVSWDLLLDLTDDLRTLLFQISNNPKIRAIQRKIPDEHAI